MDWVLNPFPTDTTRISKAQAGWTRVLKSLTFGAFLVFSLA